MNYLYFGMKNRLITFMNSTRQVAVFDIHEYPLVEISDLFNSRGAQEHKASRQIWNVHDLVIAAIKQLILSISLFRAGPPGKKSSEKQIDRRRQKLTQMLHFA